MNKSEKTKTKIFDEAKKLFWNYGYSNVSVRQIAKAAKVDVTAESIPPETPTTKPVQGEAPRT